MNILALETSTEACSAAVLTSRGDLFDEFALTPRQHTAYLPLMLESVLQRAELVRSDIDYIAFTNGPGAFTGVRIAAATAQGVAMGLRVPLVAVSTLAVLAQQASEQATVDTIVAALDARMGEVYVGRYARNPATGAVEPKRQETLIKLAQLTVGADSIGVGSGFRAQREAGIGHGVETRIDEGIYPSAAALTTLAAVAIDAGQACSPERIEINYLRNRVAEKKSSK